VKFKYVGMAVINQNLIQEIIKRRVNLGNACYYSIQNLLFSHLLSKKVKIRIYNTITLPVVLYGCETSSLTLRKERRLRVIENSVLRRIFGLKREEVIGGWRKVHNEELHKLYSLSGIIRMIKSWRVRWAGHAARIGIRGMHLGFWWESHKERDY
jgi:hypothetical protein